MMRLSILAAVIVAALAQRASAIGPSCDTETASGTGDVCISGGEDLNTQSFKLSFLDPLTGATCMDADKGEGSTWMAHDFDANPLIGTLVAICLGNVDMNPEVGGSLFLPARGTLSGSARHAAGIDTSDYANYSCASAADAGRIEVFTGSDPPYLKWCHWDGAAGHDEFAVPGGATGLPRTIGASAELDSTCDATGTFTNGDTVITLADYVNSDRQSVITATISFTAVTAASFTIKAKLEGAQVGSDVTCSAAVGFKASCTISIVDLDSNTGRTFTITASQSAGILNTVDTCNDARFTTLAG